MDYSKLDEVLKILPSLGKLPNAEWINRYMNTMCETFRQFTDTIKPTGDFARGELLLHVVAFSRYFDELTTQFMDKNEKEHVENIVEFLRDGVTARVVCVDRGALDKLREEAEKDGL